MTESKLVPKSVVFTVEKWAELRIESKAIELGVTKEKYWVEFILDSLLNELNISKKINQSSQNITVFVITKAASVGIEAECIIRGISYDLYWDEVLNDSNFKGLTNPDLIIPPIVKQLK